MTQFTLDFSEQPPKPQNRMQEVAAIFAAISDDQLRELYCNQALPPAKIGEMFGVTYPSVVRQLRLRGIPLRDRLEARAASIANGRYGEAIRKSWEGADVRRTQMSIEKRGRVVSEETKAKLSARVITPEWKEKLRIASTGHVHSEEQKRKISDSIKGKPGRNRGQKHTPERRARQSARMKGRVFSEAHRAALSKAGRGHAPTCIHPRFSPCSYLRKSGPPVELMSLYELAVAKHLDACDEEWEYCGRDKSHSLLLSDGRRYYPDFYLGRLDVYIDPKGWDRKPEKRIAVETQYPGRVVFMIGETYLDQLKELLCQQR